MTDAIRNAIADFLRWLAGKVETGESIRYGGTD
jgi:hypothetical protein